WPGWSDFQSYNYFYEPYTHARTSSRSSRKERRNGKGRLDWPALEAKRLRRKGCLYRYRRADHAGRHTDLQIQHPSDCLEAGYCVPRTWAVPLEKGAAWIASS